MSVVLEVIEGPNKGLSYQYLLQESCIVGRGSGSRFKLPDTDKYVSRRHFLIEVCPPHCIILDLKSTNKTRVNGKPIKGRRWLRDGDVITAGLTKLGVRIRNETPTPAPSPMPNGAGSPPPRSLPEGLEWIKELPFGSMAQVVLARDSATGNEVVVKTVVDGIAGREFVVECFLKETKILKSISHPNIVSYQDFRQVGDRLYLIMEHVPGEDLIDFVKRGRPIELRQAITILSQILDALEYAHERGVIHRDLKPDNVIIGPTGAKLIDFGLARIIAESSLAGPSMLGSRRSIHGFLPPEMLVNSKNVGRSADLYAAGALFYYVLTASEPIAIPQDVDDADAIQIILEQPPRSVAEHREGLPEGIGWFIEDALRKEPAKRYPDAKSMREALLHAAGAGC